MTETLSSRNPYRPGAAVSPLFLAGRDDEQRHFRAVLEAAPELPANVRITGLRGVGKTVLLKRLEEQAEDLGWLCSRVQVESRHNTDADLTDLATVLSQAMVRRVSNAARVRQAVEGVATAALEHVRVSWHDLEFSLSSGSDRERDVAKDLYDAVEVVVRHGFRGYLLMLDEAQVLRDDRDRHGSHPLSLLIAAVNALQEKELPIGLTLCGLPTLRTNLIKARTYTERMFRGEEIGRLSEPQAVEAFVRPLAGTGMEADPGLVVRVVREAEGYPYFIQLWGAAMWDAARDAGVYRLSESLLDSIEGEIYRRLDIDFYDGRVESLTPAEQDLLLASAQCPYPPLRTADIQMRVGKREGNVNVLMGRLVEQGVLFRIQKGQYDYTAPKFHEYLRRRIARPPRGH
jgi:type II secretory pathway predicted ATPase ExeA